MPAMHPIARFDDCLADTVLQFHAAERIVMAATLDQVLPALAEVEAAVVDGFWAFGCVAYEAAAALNPDLPTFDPVPGLPLVWFGLASAPDATSTQHPPRSLEATKPPAARWSIDWDEARHAAAVARVHEAIAAGESYQCNLTTRLTGRLEGDLMEHYIALVTRQGGAFNAWLDLGSHTVLSASPECFLQRNGRLLTTKPMKGTAPRMPDPKADQLARSQLLASAKEQAENIMIVDLLRNDLAQVSVPGTVEVSSLLDVEAYPSVWQLTSTIRSHAREGLSLAELFSALFPCGSVTGAPKRSTMQLIRDLEDGPRGIYCGAIGFLEPGPQPRASFSVPIRTVTVDNSTGVASYGVGSGVTWSARAAEEYAELLHKARVLSVAEVGLIETLAVDDGTARHLEHHLARLERSAAELGLLLDDAALRREIEEKLSGHLGAGLLRIELNLWGVAVELREKLELPEPVRLALDAPTVSIADPLTRLKVTARGRFDEARARHPQADDVILVNEAGLITETTIANIAVNLDGQWFTPPVQDGCLPGIGRELALASGRVKQRSLSVEDLYQAQEVALISSARGWRVGLVL